MTLQVVAADGDSISPLARLRLSSSGNQLASPTVAKPVGGTKYAAAAAKRKPAAMKSSTPRSHHHHGGGGAGAGAARLISPSNVAMKRDTSMSCSSTAQSTESSELDDSFLTHDSRSSSSSNNDSHSGASTSQQSDSNSTITTKSGVVRYLEHMKTRINDTNKIIPNLPKRLNRRDGRGGGGGKYDDGDHDDGHDHHGVKQQQQRQQQQRQQRNHHDEFGMVAAAAAAYRGCDHHNTRASPETFLHEFEYHQNHDDDDGHDQDDHLVLDDEEEEEEEQEPLEEEHTATLHQSLSLALDDAALDAMMGRTTRMQGTFELPNGMSRSDIYVTVDVDDQAFGKGSQCNSSSSNHNHIHNVDFGPVDLDAAADAESIAVLSPHQRRLARQVRASLLDDLRCVYTAHNDRAKLVLCVVVVSMPPTVCMGNQHHHQHQQRPYQPAMTMASTWRLFHADTLQLYEGGVTVVAQTPSRHRGPEHCVVHKLAPRAANDIVRRIAGSQDHDDDDNNNNDNDNDDLHQYTGTTTKMDSKVKTPTKTDFLVEV